jgi:hypothetical protein
VSDPGSDQGTAPPPQKMQRPGPLRLVRFDFFAIMLIVLADLLHLINSACHAIDAAIAARSLERWHRP